MNDAIPLSPRELTAEETTMVAGGWYDGRDPEDGFDDTGLMANGFLTDSSGWVADGGGASIESQAPWDLSIYGEITNWWHGRTSDGSGSWWGRGGNGEWQRFNADGILTGRYTETTANDPNRTLTITLTTSQTSSWNGGVWTSGSSASFSTTYNLKPVN